MVRIVDTTMVSLGYLTRRGLDLIRMMVALGLTPEAPLTHLPEGLSLDEIRRIRLRVSHPRHLGEALALPVEKVVFVWREDWLGVLEPMGREDLDRMVAVFPRASALTPADFLAKVRILQEKGLGGVVFGDWDGLLEPFAMKRVMEEILQEAALPVEVEVRNELGLAGANLLAAARSGVQGLRGTVGGIGGQGAVEEVTMACRHLLNLTVPVETSGFAALARSTAALIGRRVPRRKAIVGSETFSHESGIHVDGTLKEPTAYEAFRPEEVGLARRIILGKHSGSAAIKAVLDRFNLTAGPEEIRGVLRRIRLRAEKSKRPVPEEELVRMVRGA